MRRLKSHLFASVVAVLMVLGSQARADNINWHYNWTPGSLNVNSDAGPGGGFLTFTNEPQAAAIGSSDIVVTNIRTVSTAPLSNPDTFTTAGAYTLSLQITDDASGQTGSLTFSGKLGGSFSANNAAVMNKFTGQITQQLFLGGNTYTATIGPYAMPGPPTATNAGSISAHVDVSGINITAKDNPEPSSMALSLFGLTTVGAGWWRKRRAACAA
jgi:hypothetical protein